MQNEVELIATPSGNGKQTSMLPAAKVARCRVTFICSYSHNLFQPLKLLVRANRAFIEPLAIKDGQPSARHRREESNVARFPSTISIAAATACATSKQGSLILSCRYTIIECPLVSSCLCSQLVASYQ